MSCKYSDFEGKCTLWDADDTFEHIANSCDEKGYCSVEDDPDPSVSCEDYEER